MGIDLHRRRSPLAVLDADGQQLLLRRVTNDPATSVEQLSEIDGECKVALRATSGCVMARGAASKTRL
jgi:hypothetical protein